MLWLRVLLLRGGRRWGRRGRITLLGLLLPLILLL